MLPSRHGATISRARSGGSGTRRRNARAQGAASAPIPRQQKKKKNNEMHTLLLKGSVAAAGVRRDCRGQLLRDSTPCTMRRDD